MGGHETTTITIYSTHHLLAGHPEIKNKVRDELKAKPNLDYTSIEDLQELKYLEIVIKESMRIYSIVPFISRTLSENENNGKYPEAPTNITI